MKFPNKEKAETVKALLAIVWILVLTLGALSVMAYCWTEGFLPEGLSLTDATVLAYASFSFVVVIGFGLLMGLYCSIWIVSLCLKVANGRNRKKGKPESSLHTSLVGSANFIFSLVASVGLALVAVLAPAPVDMRLPETFGFFLTVGFVCTVLWGVKNPTVPQRNLLTNALWTLALSASFMTALRPALLNATMGADGFRSLPANLVVVDDTSHTEMLEVAKIADLKVGFCRIADTNEWGTFDARAVWYGAGNLAYVRLMDSASNGKRTVLVPLKRDGLFVLHGANTSFRCRPV
jgi:hypothetical protein